MSKDKRNPKEVEKVLKSLGVPSKTIKKAVEKVKSLPVTGPAKKVKPKKKDSDDILAGRIHSDDEISQILSIRNNFKGKTAKDINASLKAEKMAFIEHYNNLFENGASEFPGILEFYSVLPNIQKAKTPAGKGFIFKMEPEDAKAYGKDIIKYFLIKNIDIFPLKSRAKLALDSYLMLMELSGVDKKYVETTKEHYYNKYGL